MSKPIPELSPCQAFECFHFESETSGKLFPVPPHSHFFSEILLVRGGTCRVERKGITHLLSPGELIYIAPLVRHSVESADGGPVVFDVVKFSAARLREIPSYLTDLRALAADAAQIRLPIQMNAEDVHSFHMDDIIRECITENGRREFGWDLHVRALIYLLINALARYWISRRESLADSMPTEHNPVLDIPAYIAEHISEPLRVEDLARRCSLSYPWFARRFHEYFGISCKQLIERLRVETVEQYLHHTDLDLSEISNRTGYTDASHMVKDFRRMTGLTPGQFRSMLRQRGLPPFSCFSGRSTPNHPSKG